MSVVLVKVKFLIEHVSFVQCRDVFITSSNIYDKSHFYGNV